MTITRVLCHQKCIKGGRTPPTHFFFDDCYARLLLLYTYRGFSTTEKEVIEKLKKLENGLNELPKQQKKDW